MGKVEKRRMDWGRHPDTKACPPTPSRLFPVPPGREVWYGCFCSQNQLYTMSVTASVVSPRLPPWASPCRPHMNIATATRSSSSSACEIKLFWNNFDIISVFCFTRNRVWNWNEIISAAERVPTLFQNRFSDIERVGKCLRATISLRNNFEIISFFRVSAALLLLVVRQQLVVYVQRC